MTKRDVKRQRSRAHAAAVGAQRAASAGKVAEIKTGRPAPVRALSGLEWLTRKRRLNREQRKAGDAYGVRYRASVMEGTDSLRSCLDITPGGGGAGVPMSHGETAAWVATMRKELSGARAALSFHAGMIAVCDLVCGKGLLPGEIIPENRREAAEIETTLRLALDIMHPYFREQNVV